MSASPHPALQYTPTWRQRLARWRGSTVEHDLSPYTQHLSKIEDLGRPLKALSDHQLTERGIELGARLRSDNPESSKAEVFALVREAARRTVDMRHYDVQIVAGMALRHGKIIEMQTGEGKTLVAVLSVVFHALAGLGAHVLTFNDYLARRDAEWMGPIYRQLGLSVGWIQEDSTPDERRAAYAADVTYVTAKEAGFDFLRDQLATDPADLMQRPFHFALVDEADSLLIDEARVPLVLAGSVEREMSQAPRLAQLVATFEPGVDFQIEEYDRNVELTEAGFERAERELGCGNLLDEPNYRLFTELNCALHAHNLLRRDVDYIIRNGRLELVDELTGRVAENRHWPDGLQAALEAKEGLARRPDGRILGSITLEHFLTGYPHLCGMTGTAQSAADELHELYDLDVVVIPTHEPMIRKDQPDLVFTHRAAKAKALIDEIRQQHKDGRPILVGTASVGESEQLAAQLREADIACNVLNAKNDLEEAAIIARAGALGAVTISTNMAGRGTDIRLGGEDGADHQRVADLGGLYVIGTNRHESERIDLQLRGRAGRQGDPGESRFFVSLEDPLMERYGLRQLLPSGLLPDRRVEPVEHPIVRGEIARAQRIIEGQNLEIRRTLWRYSTPIEDQRVELFRERQNLLLGGEPGIWHQKDSVRHAEMVAAHGREAVRAAEVAITLHTLDRAWSDHLAQIASRREGIHLVGLGGKDPLTTFQLETAEDFHRMRDEIDEAVAQAFDRVTSREGGLELSELEVRGPSSTWTYLINDDPFRQQLGRMLTGPGQTTMAIGAAMFAAPLLILWALVDRFGRRQPQKEA